MRSSSRSAFVPNIVKSFAIACVAMLSMTTQAAEISTDPGDYAALPAGIDLGIVYYQHAERNSYYASGRQLPGSFKLETDIGLARWVHFTKLGDYVIDPQVIVPFGTVKLNTPFGPLNPTSASGVGDPLVGGTLWLMNRAEQKQWFGVSAFASVPFGDYSADRGPVNVGEHRWKGIFQAGYVGAITDNVMLDVIGEYSVYGDNNNFLGMKKEQDASYGIQTHLRYMLSPTSHVALSFYHDEGGETRLNGVAQHDKMNNDRWLATFATFVAPTVQLQVQAGESLRVENGAKESSRVNLRLVKVF